MNAKPIQTITDTLVWSIVDERSTGEELAKRIRAALKKAGYTIVRTDELKRLRAVIPLYPPR
jgi:hypothetical protein